MAVGGLATVSPGVLTDVEVGRGPDCEDRTRFRAGQGPED